MPDLNERVRRAEEAERMLHKDSLLSQVFDALEAEYTDGWKRSQITEISIREKFYSQYYAIRELRDSLRSLVGDGTRAARDMERIKREEGELNA